MTIHWDFWFIKLPAIFLGPLVFNGIFDTSVPYWGLVLFLFIFWLITAIEITTTF